MRPLLLSISGQKAGRSYFQLFLAYPSDMQEGVSCYYSLACVNMSKISFPT